MVGKTTCLKFNTMAQRQWQNLRGSLLFIAYSGKLRLLLSGKAAVRLDRFLPADTKGLYQRVPGSAQISISLVRSEKKSGQRPSPPPVSPPSGEQMTSPPASNKVLN